MTEPFFLDGELPSIMVSIRPRHVEAIAEGRKTVELRRRFPNIGGRLVIYATLPVGAVVGVARIARIDRAYVGDIWNRYQAEIGIEQAEFQRYFGETHRGVAIRLGDYLPLFRPVTLTALRSIWPGFQPPQAFRFWSPQDLDRLIEMGGIANLPDR